MPPNEDCPICGQKIADWHVEWYATERPALHKGQAPACGQPVGYAQGKLGSAPSGIPVVKRSSAKAAEWAAFGAAYAGGTLYGYITTPGAGIQWANYWSLNEVQQADADEIAKQGP